MKFMKILLIISCLFLGCEKDSEPTGPDEPPVDDHDQGQVESG